jgi:hypothetical protein
VEILRVIYDLKTTKASVPQASSEVTAKAWSNKVNEVSGHPPGVMVAAQDECLIRRPESNPIMCPRALSSD